MRTKEDLAAYMREYRRKRRSFGDPIKDASTWEDNQKNRYRKYGLTEESYIALFNKQDGKCAICAATLRMFNCQIERKHNTHIDHCHTTGRVRGILCSGCNLGIGQFKDNVETLLSAIAYLQKP